MRIERKESVEEILLKRIPVKGTVTLKCPKCGKETRFKADKRRKKTCPYCGFVGFESEWERVA